MPLLVQHIDITGIWALAFLAAISNVIIFDLIYERRPMTMARPLGFALGLLLLMCGYGALRLARDIPIRDYMRVVLVQQNSDSWAGNPQAETLRINQRLTSAGLQDHNRPARSGRLERDSATPTLSAVVRFLQ